MRKLFYNPEFPENEISSCFKELQEQIIYLQNNYQYDTASLEFFDWLTIKLRIIQSILNTEVRFNYVLIQNEIDRLYKSDPTITGVDIQFDFKRTENPNRGRFSLLIKKSS